MNSLRKRGTPVEYILFPDEGHGFLKQANQIRSTVSLVEFFRASITIRCDQVILCRTKSLAPLTVVVNSLPCTTSRDYQAWQGQPIMSRLSPMAI